MLGFFCFSEKWHSHRMRYSFVRVGITLKLLASTGFWRMNIILTEVEESENISNRVFSILEVELHKVSLGSIEQINFAWADSLKREGKIGKTYNRHNRNRETEIIGVITTHIQYFETMQDDFYPAALLLRGALKWGWISQHTDSSIVCLCILHNWKEEKGRRALIAFKIVLKEQNNTFIFYWQINHQTSCKAC